MSDIVAGAIGGLAAGTVLTAFMVVGSRAGLLEDPLPQKVERWSEDRLGVHERSSPREEEVVGQTGHLLASAALGALCGALRPRRGSVVREGPLFGVGLYALALAGLGPALGITRGPQDVPMTVNARRLMMHTVFGTVTAAVTEQLAPRLR